MPIPLLKQKSKKKDIILSSMLKVRKEDKYKLL